MANARWLSEEEGHAWHHFVQAYHLLERQIEQQLQRDAGLSHAQYNVLVVLSEQPGNRLRMTELARNAKITRSRLSHAIARLEKNGWVRREECPSDKRGQNAVLTEEGYAMLSRSAPGHVDAVRHALFDRLTPEQVRSLGDIMRVLAHGLEPEGTDADLPWLR